MYRKTLLLCLIALTCVPDSGFLSLAQDREGSIRVTSRDDMLRKLPESVSYLLPVFTESTLVYANGSSADGKVNICLLDNSVRFINPSGDTLLLANADFVSSVMAGDTLLIQRDGQFVKCISLYGDLSLCERRSFTFSEPDEDAGYSGIPATSTAKQVRVQSVDYARTYGREVEIPWKLKTEYVLDDGSRTIPARRSSFIKLFPECADQVRAFIKEHSVDFKDLDDLVGLFQYCAETDMSLKDKQ